MYLKESIPKSVRIHNTRSPSACTNGGSSAVFQDHFHGRWLWAWEIGKTNRFRRTHRICSESVSAPSHSTDSPHNGPGGPAATAQVATSATHLKVRLLSVGLYITQYTKQNITIRSKNYICTLEWKFTAKRNTILPELRYKFLAIKTKLIQYE